jgi:hypothetical protein
MRAEVVVVRKSFGDIKRCFKEPPAPPPARPCKEVNPVVPKAAVPRAYGGESQKVEGVC